ncbi:MAG: tetratricopeptide repeat protein [Candidatus Sericytochromatia bacterium]
MDQESIQGVRRLRLDPVADRRKAEQRLRIANKVMETALRSGEPDRKLIAQALELYDQTIELAPDLAEPYLKLAYLSAGFGQWAAAIQLLKTLQAHNPFCSEAEAMIAQYQTELLRSERQAALSQLANKALKA